MFGWDDAIDQGLKILDKFIPDTNERAKAREAFAQSMLDAKNKSESDQRDIDKAEATNGSLFVAGWRPAVGWLCVGVLAYSWMIAPLLTWAIAIGAELTGHGDIHLIGLPTLGASDSQTLLYALLGIGAMRTVDGIAGTKTQGIAGGIMSLLPFGKK